MDQVANRIQNLSPSRRKLLERLHSKAANNVKSYPLAYAQRGMWFINQLEPDLPLYNMPLATRYTGPLDHQAVWRSIREIVSRHESLRTIFPTRGGVAVQEVLPSLPSLEQTIDLTHLPKAEREEQLKKLVREHAGEALNLARGPLFRCVLFQLSEDDHVLLFNLHHIVGDGWSISILCREFDALYRAYSRGEHVSPLKPLELQFGDYAIWQRGWLHSGATERQQMSFWKEQLADVAEVVLPTDYPRPSVLAHGSGHYKVSYSPELSARLLEFCRHEDVTPFMALLAAYQLAVATYLGVMDFTVGTPVANRNRLETEDIIGCFINTLVLRSDVAEGLNFRQLVARVRERTLSAYENQDLPFERLVEELAPFQILSRTPLFQAMYSFENFPSISYPLPGLTQAHMDAGLRFTKVEMTLSVAVQDGIFRASFEYDSALYVPARMQRLMEHFQLLLEAMVNDPKKDIWDASLLPETECRHLTVWSKGESHSNESTVVELFEKTAQQHAHSAALITEAGPVLYSQLNAQSNQWAQLLSRLGVGPEVSTGVLMERSADLYAAVLGIMKAGGVYVPMDPMYPADRLAWMAADAGLKVLLVDEHTRALAPAGPWILFNVQAQRSELEAASVDARPSWVSAENLAYVIYTSGSTGQPKGVGISHRALASQLLWIRRAFALTPQDRFLQKASISFDSSIEEILAPLVSGGCLVAARPQGEYDIQYLADLVAREAVTCIDLTPSLLDALLDVADPKSWGCVRLVISGGEALRPELVRSFQEKFSATLLNTYGPTETTVQSAWSNDLSADESVPIGRPIDNTQLYVLDSRMALAPVGTPGELYIAGAGLARGYVGRPEQTAGKFVPNPFGEDGERLYRTGDQVKWREDGQLEYLGRMDNQVKLRGYRIELGEIERVLEQQAGIEQAVVVVREDQPGRKQLVAYLVVGEGVEGEVGGESLRGNVGQVLPGYMVPAAFVVLDKLPLTRNGKLDRKALPAPDQSAYGVREYEEPRTETEGRIAEIFKEVLKLERIGRQDNFFELGGHSLLAVQLISRIQKAMLREFRLVDLFTNPTVAQIAATLQNVSLIKLPPITRAEVRQNLPLSFAQQQLWLLNHIEGADRAYNIALGLKLKGRLEGGALRRALNAIVMRHEVLRTAFHTVNDEPVQYITPVADGVADGVEDGLFHLVEDDLRQHPQAQQVQGQLIEQEAGAAFDLGRGPLIRGRLIHLPEQEYILLVTMHHVVSDAWSVGLFWEEFKRLYSAFQAGLPNPLAPLSLQYGDYAVWQRQWLSGDFLQEQTEYWKSTLAEAPEQLQLPLDRPRPAQQDFLGDFFPFQLDAELTSGLRRLSQSQGTTLYMTLLSGWAALLGRLSGQQDVVIGSPTVNRPRQELEELIGFFINMLALRINLSGSVTVKELLQRVKTVFLAAQQHEHLSFAQVVEVTRPVRSAAYSPIFQAILVWQRSVSRGTFLLPELKVEGLEMGVSPTAKFDLTLALEEHEETIGGGIEYATALFERATIERFHTYFITLLQEMVADNSQCMDHLSYLPEAERQQVVHGWNDEAVLPLASVSYAYQMIEEQARRTPGAAAIVHGAEVLTYEELNRHANQLAHHLRVLGVGAEERVGLCLERGPGMIIGLLAVLKAGGAYVPLDPAYPRARLQAMLEDSAPSVVLTQEHLRELCSREGAVLVDMDEADGWRQYSGSDLEPGANLGPDRLAYVIYTSGSTGVPKGVMLQHANLKNFLGWGQQVFAADVLAGTLGSTSLSFDLAVFECLLPLTCGGTVHIVADVLELVHRQEPITLINTVPSAMEALLDSGSIPETVRVVNLAGEPLKSSLVERIFARSQAEAVYNLYGPTETTTYSSYTRVERGNKFGGHIGRPIGNTRIYILDRQGQPVGVGVTGELHIGGAGVARGYFRRAELSAERFQKDPFVAQAEARMYKTGDLGRWQPDGNIEYLGRMDNQVKLRGYRIELGEIERVLEQQAGIEQAVVVVREDQPGRKQLVAYLVVGEGVEGEVGGESLRGNVGQVLPGYMVPAAFVVLDKLPLTRNGKLDRKALPAPDQSAYGVREYEEPRTETEGRIAEIFKEVLKLERIGRQDNFFELGGHSLLAVRLIRRIEGVFTISMRLQQLFELPSVALMAAWIDRSAARHEHRQGRHDLPDGVIELKKGDGRAPFFLIHPIGGTVFCYVELASALAPPQSVYAIETIVDDGQAGALTVELMAQSYLQSIQAVQPFGPYRLGGWSFGGLVAWEVAKQMRQQGEKVTLLALIDTYPPSGEHNSDRDDLRRRAMSLLYDEVIRNVIKERTKSDPEMGRSVEGELELSQLEDLLVQKGLAAHATRQHETSRLLAAYEQNLSAMENYSVQPARQPAILFAASESGYADYIYDQWTKYAQQNVARIMVPGSHYTMMRGASAARIAQHINQALDGTAMIEGPNLYAEMVLPEAER